MYLSRVFCILVTPRSIKDVFRPLGVLPEVLGGDEGIWRICWGPVPMVLCLVACRICTFVVVWLVRGFWRVNWSPVPMVLCLMLISGPVCVLVVVWFVRGVLFIITCDLLLLLLVAVVVVRVLCCGCLFTCGVASSESVSDCMV